MEQKEIYVAGEGHLTKEDYERKREEQEPKEQKPILPRGYTEKHLNLQRDYFGRRKED